MADSRVGVGNKWNELGTSLVAQWLRICIAMQGMQVWAGWGIKVPHVVAVHSLSHAWLCYPMVRSTSGFPVLTISWSLLKLMFTESVMPSNHLILLSSPSPPVFNLSQHQGLFRWVSSSHQVAKVSELQLQYQSFQYSGLISFRID